MADAPFAGIMSGAGMDGIDTILATFGKGGPWLIHAIRPGHPP